MKIFKNTTVYEEALNRIRWIFDEFENVMVGFSGGKDSTVVVELALEVARERNRLPLTIAFIDQEAEWQATVDYVEYMMNRDEIEPLWYQMPIRISNATSGFQRWLYCWDDADEGNWIRDKSPISIKENTFGTKSFYDLFNRILDSRFNGNPACLLGGVRTQESPSRYAGLTSVATYKHITYGKVVDRKKDQYIFYPVYDWEISDVWKYIHDHGLKYNRVYDYMYQYGVPVKDMRVSNLHHETAMRNLFFLQEVEPETWEKCVQRIHGINTAGHLAEDYFQYDLPYMFEGWKDYRDYLMEHLIISEEDKEKFRKRFAKMDVDYEGMAHIEDMYKACIAGILANDNHMVKINNFETRPNVVMFRKWKKGTYKASTNSSKYIPEDN